MSYQEWFDTHAKKHLTIISKLRKKKYNKTAIISYFDFENMCHEEEDFCPLYKENKKCHEIEHLNCYLCACPNFRFDDKGIETLQEKMQYSFCAINSKDGIQGIYGDCIHQDCSKCTIPHHKSYVEAHFDWDWKKIMSDCKN